MPADPSDLFKERVNYQRVLTATDVVAGFSAACQPQLRFPLALIRLDLQLM